MGGDDAALFRIAGPGRIDRCVDRTGADRIDADALAGEFQRQRARQIGHAALADRVSEIAGLRDDLVHAGAIDDAAASAARDEMGERLLRAQHGAVEIDVDDAAIGFDIERIARRFPLEAGIVDETVETLPA